VPRSLSEKLEVLRHTSVKVEIEFTKRYYRSINLLMQLTRTERILLDFITEEMNEENYVTNSISVRKKLNYLLKNAGQEPFTDNTVSRCFSGLCKINLIVKVKGRGLYQVNPLFYFKGSEEERQRVIRKKLEHINKIPINKYRQELIISKALSCGPEQESD
jgi:hypothetical protein